MKLSARRRIVIPFLFLVLVPVLFLSVFFYVKQRNLYIQSRIEINENRLNDLVELVKNYENSLANRNFIIEYVDNLDMDNMFIIDNDELIYSSLSQSNIGDQQIKDAVAGVGQIEGYNLTYKVFNQWRWRLGVLTSLEVSPRDVVDINGIVVGIAVLFMLFVIEVIVLITENFYKPVKILLKGYNDIISGNYQSEIDISSGGEMGMLGMAFNDMKNTIAHRTNKAIEMRKMTDDILSSISTGIITTDMNGRIINYNAAAGQMIGFDDSTAEDEYDVDVVKVLVSQINRTLKTSRTINEIAHFSEHLKNETVYYDITTSAMINEEGQKTGVICSFNDISQRKRVEERIERLDKMASLGQLSAGLAHEIRNPLSGMKMSTQVLHNRLKEHLNASEDRMFTANIKEIDRLNLLISELLEFSKPQIPHIKTVNLLEAVQHSLRFAQAKIDEKMIQVEIEDLSSETYVYFDENQLSQVLLNVLRNAIDAMGKGGRLKVRCSEAVLGNEPVVAVHIEDDGCGIGEENIKQIYDPFFTTKKSGTGLGLSVVHRLVVANHGEIEVSSRSGEGTVFTIYMQRTERVS